MLYNELTSKRTETHSITLEGCDITFDIVSLNERINSLRLKDPQPHLIKNPLMAIMNNPVTAGIAASFAITALDKYRQNRKNTTHFFAKTLQERAFYEKIINDLLKTGHYKVIRKRHVKGGYLWELRRTR